MDPLISSLGIPDGMAGWAMIQNKQPTAFQAFMQDPVIQQQIAYFRAHAPKATTAAALLKDPRLQDFALTAFGLSSQIGMTALMQQVLNSNPNDSKSAAARMTAPQYSAIATAFNYGGTATPAVPATASSAQVTLSTMPDGTLTQFSGNFAGLSLNGVDLSADSSPTDVAATLQAAFRRADGNRTDISVQAVGFQLVFTDAAGRGSARGFSFVSAPGGATASAATVTAAGAPAVAATGGPAVTSGSFINQVVQKYIEAQFQVVVGGTSNTLREAVYAQQTLPTVTNWYSVIADPALADVIHTVLNLPSSFAMLNVDKQAQILASKMKLSDFQNPARLGQLLNKFVAISSMNSSTGGSGGSFSPALVILGGK